MCGFLAMIGDRWAKDFPTALDSLASRGPDARGMWERGPVRLGHRRLSVIDLEGGVQPMASADERYCLTYNGEIYNFQTLRDELQAAGRQFATNSDTEVLLQGYAQWGGPALLKKLDGMFAFAIWDAHEKQLFAARDRFGIKPMFYSTLDGIVLSSTLEPFFHLTDFPRRMYYPALREYLACQSIPSPMTILRDVASLPPAGWLQWSLDTSELKTGQYWDIPSANKKAESLETLIEQTHAALTESVKRQLIADVPLGAFLSGGIDSSLMVHYMAQASSQPVKTFSVRFADQGEYDESDHARVVAEAYGCEHHVFEAGDIDAAQLVAAVGELDQPIADPAYLPTRALSRLTREHVTVAISGDGGDELFGGYNRFLQDEMALGPTMGKKALSSAIDIGLLPRALSRKAFSGVERMLWDRVKFGPFPGTRKDMQSVLAPEAFKACDASQTLADWFRLANRFADPITSDALMRADLWTYLSENCLVKTDRASMAHSLEVRVPLLGNPVADLILPQPAGVKLQGGLKTILKSLAQKHLPQQVWDRPKHGFSVPLRSYFESNWRDTCQQWVDQVDQLAPFLNAENVRRRWSNALAGKEDQRTAYTLVVLLGWLTTHRVDP